jgi:hypothetical protein
MLSEYRQRFSDYHTELNRENYLFRSGRKDRKETAHIVSEYSDLFRLTAVGDLRAALKETSDYRETEQASIKRLIAFALNGNLALRVSEISQEIEKYEEAADIDWDGRKISFVQSAGLVTNESEVSRRRDLEARRAGVIQGAQDLWAERFGILQAATRELGYENRLTMLCELRGMDYEQLASQAALILSKTESKYVSALSSLLIRETGLPIDEATLADLEYMQRFSGFDHFFSRERMIETYRELFAGLGFRVERQSNVEVDSEPHPGKQSQAFCAPVRIPGEIKLVINLIGGQERYREFLRASGQTQLFAWTSQNLYPEFRIGGDPAVHLAWGMLVENLMLEEHWLMGTFGFVESKRFRQALEVLRLAVMRQNSASLGYQVDFHSGRLSGNAGARYAESMTDAVRVQCDETGHLRDVTDSLYPADFLRACAFEAQMREYLKTRFGVRWWVSRKAGEMLIDLWNTGQRYRVEELATMIGLGELDIDWLAAELVKKIEG